MKALFFSSNESIKSYDKLYIYVTREYNSCSHHFSFAIFCSLYDISSLKYSLLVNQSKNRYKIVPQILKQKFFFFIHSSPDPFISCLVHLICVYYYKALQHREFVFLASSARLGLTNNFPSLFYPS